MIEIKFKGLSQVLSDFSKLPESVQKAKISALNKTAKQARTEASKAIRQRYNLNANELSKKDSRTKLARLGYETAKESNGFISKVIARGQGMPLKYFGARQTKKGVSLAILKGDRKTLPGTFGPNIPRLGGHVFTRLGKERLPIKRLLGPGVANMMGETSVITKVKKYVETNLKRIFDHELKFFAKKTLK